LGSSIAIAQPPAESPPAKAKAKDKGPRLDLDMVRDFVGAAHRDLEKVKALHSQQPALINSSWDWGGGDWETALGAAAHTGRKNIAEFLLSKGARLDIFAAAMLGKIELVKAAITLFPGTEKTLGPHGITLIAHAKAGKEPAEPVVKFLETLTT
jgi:hypothetical protein